jgi:hypothetical protein
MKKLAIMISVILFPLVTRPAVIVRLLSPGDIAQGVTIGESGLYVLGNDATIAAGTAITITTSDVTIDFNGRAIRGSNAASCIALNNNIQNITVKNGKILGSFTSNGILVNAGCQNLDFEDLTISGSSNNSTSLNGINFASGSARTAHVIIRNCQINNASIGLVANQTDDIALEYVTFNFNGTGMSITNCNASYMSYCRATNNTSLSTATSFGLSLANSNCWSLKNSEFNFNQNSVRGTGAFISNSTNTVIDTCNFFANGATGASSTHAEGCHLSQSSSCIIRNSVANGNFSITCTVAGIRVDTSSFGNSIEDSTASVNSSSSALFNAYGFMLDTSSSNVNFYNCTAEGNSAPVPAAGTGFFVGSTIGSCLIKDCKALFNTNAGAMVNSTNTYLISNVMIGNGVISYTGAGVFGFVNVTNGATPPRGTFDEKLLDNVAITAPA